MNFQTYLGDSLEVLKTIPSNSVDSLVTDPPAGIGLMGLEWDKNKGGRDQWISWLSKIMNECHRVLKPGAHGVVWALPRTSHWTSMSLEESGFLIKDIIVHIFGNGFPKNICIDKTLKSVKYTDTDQIYRVTDWIRRRRDELGLTNHEIDSLAGVRGGASHWTAGPNCSQPHIPTPERWEKLESKLGPAPDWVKELIYSEEKENSEVPQSKSLQWKGWGTALKPANEHWILIQKPISEHNIASNITKHSVGGINIDDCRTPVLGDKIPSTSYLKFGSHDSFLWNLKKRNSAHHYEQHPKGRFPSNVIISKSKDGSLERIMNKQGERKNVDVSEYFFNVELEIPFVYCKRADGKDRGTSNTHPTVKSTKLMQYLTRLVTPTNGLILDPFMGSGSTGVAALKESFQFIGIEKSEDYYRIAVNRLNGVKYE